jgi:hypothetical protein
VEAARADVICFLLLRPPNDPSIFFLSSAHTVQTKENPCIAVSIAMPKYDQIHVGYCNTCVGIGEEEACEVK